MSKDIIRSLINESNSVKGKENSLIKENKLFKNRKDKKEHSERNNKNKEIYEKSNILDKSNKIVEIKMKFSKKELKENKAKIIKVNILWEIDFLIKKLINKNEFKK